MVAVSQLWFAGVPLALGVAGWVACRRKAVASALLFGGLLFPLYHLATANPVGDSKHAVFGILFTLPLAGLLVSRVPRGLPGVVLATLVVGAAGAFGVAQAQRIDRAWVDVDPAARYVAAHARPGDRFLIDDAWPFTRRLYAADKVRDPWAVVDTYRLAHRQADLPICRYDWFVAAQGAGQWPAALRRRVAACGTFRRVFASSAPVTSLGRSLRFVTWTGHVEVFRNTRRRARAPPPPRRATARREPRAPTGPGPLSVRFRLLLPVVVAALSLWLPFAVAHTNPHALWLAVPFLAANVLLAVSLLVTFVNNWSRSNPGGAPETSPSAPSPMSLSSSPPVASRPQWSSAPCAPISPAAELAA